MSRVGVDTPSKKAAAETGSGFKGMNCVSLRKELLK